MAEFSHGVKPLMMQLMEATNPPCDVIGVYLEMPGLKMCAPASFLLAGLFTEPIKRALAAENLLAEKVPPNVKAVMELAVRAVAALKKFAATQEKIRASKPLDVAALAKMMHGHLKVMREGASVGCLGHDNWFFLLAHVIDVARGLMIVRGELERLNLLQFVEIAHVDFAENLCRTFHPPNCIHPFERRVVLMLHYREKGLDFFKGGEK